MKKILLIDGKNTGMRAIFASRMEIMNGCHPFVPWMRTVRTVIERFKPSEIHVFWDCKTREVWRKGIYEAYKDNRSRVYSRDDNFDVGATIGRLEDVAHKLLPHMAIYQYKRDKQEADDLIYSACRVFRDSIIVMSSDKDLLQIVWRFPNAKLWDPIKSEFLETDVDPVTAKALMGDKSDNIDGYRGIGKVKSRAIATDARVLSEFLEERGGGTFWRNLKLVDLNHNPYLLDNDAYILSSVLDKPKLDNSVIRRLIMENKVRGFMADYHNLVVPLRRLA